MVSDEEGRRLVMRWTRAITAGVTLGQAYAFAALLQAAAIVPPLDWFSTLVLVLQLTAGTMTLVFLGELIDEAGLGFGNGVLWIYALSAVAIQLQRLQGFAITASAYGTFSPFVPLALWIGASVVLVLAAVAVLRAYRAIALVGDRRAAPSRPLILPLVMSGVLRPPVFTT
jgi:preprotein translocase subunit SecY